MCQTEQISALIDGELTQAEAERVLAHIGDCPSCRALYKDFQTMRRGFAALEAAVPDAMRPSIIAACRPARFRRIARSFAGAAACLIVVFAVVWLLPHMQPAMNVSEEVRDAVNEEVHEVNGSAQDDPENTLISPPGTANGDDEHFDYNVKENCTDNEGGLADPAPASSPPSPGDAKEYDDDSDMYPDPSPEDDEDCPFPTAPMQK